MVLNYNKNKTEEILKSFGNKINGRILEIGCNEGNFIQRFGKKEYIGLDKDVDALKKAREKGLKVIKRDLNLQKLPFENNQFDTVLALDVIEHLFDPIKTINEIKRVSNKGGRIIISLPNDYNLINLMRIFLLNKPIIYQSYMWKKDTHLHFPTVKESEKMVSKYFSIEKKKYIGDKATVPFIPKKIRKIFVKIFPRFFSKCIVFSCINNKK